MSDIVERLRERQQDMAEAIERLDSGEMDNGIMRVIRLESHDLYKTAANEIDRLQKQVVYWREAHQNALVGCDILQEEVNRLCSAPSKSEIEELRREINELRSANHVLATEVSDLRTQYVFDLAMLMKQRR